MFRVIFIFICVTSWCISAYPTDNPISEPPNIMLTSPDDITALDVSAQDDGDCDLQEESSPLPMKREDVQGNPPPIRRCRSQNFIRLGRAGFDPTSELEIPDEYIRLARAGKSNGNFVRFGRGSKGSNFIRLGRDKSDNFIRFGRGKTDSFIRLGRGKSDNFVRLGREKPANFIRFGRGKPDNFIRFGRGKQDNFIRFGRGMRDNFVRFGRDGESNFEDTFSDAEEDISNENVLRMARGGKPDSNFIRFGRAKGSNFIRLGRANENEQMEREERGKGNNFVRFGRNFDDEDFLRTGRSGSNDLRRGKLTDRNFIRLGRSGGQYEIEDTREYNSDESSVRSGRSNNDRNFIRLGKRADENLLRFGRDVEQIDDMPVLSSTESNQSETENKTDHQQSRDKRSVSYSGSTDTTEESSDYPALAKMPFGYYSPLTSGIPNYILGPELAVLAPLSNGAESFSKRSKARDHSRNYIRLG
ncbi:hypothetical protein L9F63_019926 [Diploptera punctata]|uniref:Uncharacterized protein n=1 Tax=Diploptera punctata TaxID=6984 RepID=A0AAD7ZU13_DIPPU|nr:hypothetical protein L9F63_019926 [Diploptera punctata]